ncbi:MAG: hypothetical protein QME57_05110, partial [Patescibacteria group bacterium]|nr:hypothetical protein [Patescibacteria group bacterium]
GLFRGYSNAIFDGNVSIGTTTPSQKLTLLDGNIYLTNRQFSVTKAGNYYEVVDSGVKRSTPKCICDKNDDVIDCPDEGWLTTDSVGTVCYDWWKDKSANNYPRAEKFEVRQKKKGASSYTVQPELIFNDVFTEDWTYSLRNVAGTLQFTSGYSETPRMVIGADGHVGIGTTGPGYELDVNGDINLPATGFLRIAGNSGEKGQVLTRTDTGMAWQTPTGGIGGIGGNGKTNYIPLWTDNKTLGNSVIYQSGDKVGIGTTGPGAKLDVAGKTILQGRLQLGHAVTTWIDDAIDGFKEPVVSNDGFIIVPGYTGTEDSDLRLYITDNANDRFSIWGDTCGGGTCNDLNKASLAHYFQAGGNAYHKGRVGIGTTGPEAKLHIKQPDHSWGSGIYLEDDNTTNKWQIFQEYDNRLTFGYNNSHKVAITSAGNVGIGTTAPNEKLTVYAGNISVMNDPSQTGYKYEHQETVNGHQTPRCSCDSNNESDECSSPHISPSDKGQFCYDQTKTVGTGASVSRKFKRTASNVVTGGSLHVYNLLTIGSEGHPSAYAPAISFNAPSSGDNYTIEDSGGTLRFINNDGASKLVISQDGKVGIGTTEPKALLDIDMGNNLHMHIGSHTNSSNERVQFYYDPSVARVRLNAVPFKSVESGSANGLSFGTAQGPDQMVINQDGKVGIGTTEPQKELDV